MDFSLISDTVTLAATQQGLGFGKFLLKRSDFTSGNHLSFTDSSSDQSAVGVVQVSAVLFPVDTIAPPPVKSSSYKTIRRTHLRKKRRTRRISFRDDSEDGDKNGEWSGDGNAGGFDGPVGGGGSGGGGSGWNFGGFGGRNWDDSASWPSWSDPAMGFVYEVICWIALSNCVHFAFKRVVRIVADGEREKLTMRLTSVC